MHTAQAALEAVRGCQILQSIQRQLDQLALRPQHVSRRLRAPLPPHPTPSPPPHRCRWRTGGGDTKCISNQDVSNACGDRVSHGFLKTRIRITDRKIRRRLLPQAPQPDAATAAATTAAAELAAMELEAAAGRCGGEMPPVRCKPGNRDSVHFDAGGDTVRSVPVRRAPCDGERGAMNRREESWNAGKLDRSRSGRMVLRDDGFGLVSDGFGFAIVDDDDDDDSFGAAASSVVTRPGEAVVAGGQHVAKPPTGPKSLRDEGSSGAGSPLLSRTVHSARQSTAEHRSSTGMSPGPVTPPPGRPSGSNSARAHRTTARPRRRLEQPWASTVSAVAWPASFQMAFNNVHVPGS